MALGHSGVKYSPLVLGVKYGPLVLWVKHCPLVLGVKLGSLGVTYCHTVVLQASISLSEKANTEKGLGQTQPIKLQDYIT